MKTIVTLFSTKARIKLNPKKLYQADSEAVQEILKIVTLLYKVLIILFRLQTVKESKNNKQQQSLSLLKFQI